MVLNILNSEIRYEYIKNYLEENSTKSYKLFSEKIIPNSGNSYGVKVGPIKKLAKDIVNSKDNVLLLQKLFKSNMYEEKLLYGYIISLKKYNNFTEYSINIDNYIKLIDNWALCDLFVSSIKKNKKRYEDELFIYAKQLIDSDNEWEVRTGLVIILSNYLDEEKLDEILNLIKKISIDSYYVKMAIAWLLSVMYIKYPDKITEIIKKKSLDKWIINKSIQKIIESNRVSKESKEDIRYYKIK